METLKPAEHFMRVATACPEVALTDVNTNVERITALYSDAAEQQASLVVFPELSLTGYTIGDLVQNRQLLDDAQAGLLRLAAATKGQVTAMVIGLPLAVGNAIYNCAALLADGEIRGIVPKTHLPNYNEFYDKRWYQHWDQPNTKVSVGDADVPFGTDLLFEVGGVKVGMEICEDLWVDDPPSRIPAEHGALIIANPSASPELIGKATYRRQLVGLQSARLLLGYIYAGCDSSESTMDIVMGGHQLIAENGGLLAERKPLTLGQRLTVTDVDIDHLERDRRKDTNVANKVGMQIVKCSAQREQADLLRYIEKHPFLPPETAIDRNERLALITAIQATGLAERMKRIGQEKLVLGLSGGLDSTLSLLVAVKAAHRLGRNPGDMIRTLTMPGPASSERTQDNAVRLAEALGIPNEVIPITDLVKAGLEAVRHDGQDQDITYENIQARARTSIVFNYGNKEHCLALGTGDLSEIALGWCTFNGDHMSHYNVNASIPKTLVRSLVDYLAHETENTTARATLEGILDTPISPELTTDNSGEVNQRTEDIIGPYELHDFFLYHLIRWAEAPKKIRYLAHIAFKDEYETEEIDKWLALFLKRFSQNQFKRSVMPDGPKVGSVALSPRGDWRMPSDLPDTPLFKLVFDIKANT